LIAYIEEYEAEKNKSFIGRGVRKKKEEYMEDRKFENTDSESDSEKIDTFDDMMNAFADEKSECGLPISRFADKSKKKRRKR